MSLPPPLPGLLPAAFRGIGFYVTDASSDVGRRIAAHYFPGIDVSAYDDQGKQPHKIKISGLYMGDDYISHAKALQSAFEQPDIGTLMHPWLGTIRVVVSETATISFAAQELRMMRFEAAFEKAEDNLLAKLFSKIGLGSIPRLLSAANTLMAQAKFALSFASKGVMSRILSDAAMRVGGTFFSAIRSLPGSSGHILGALLPDALPQSIGSFGGLTETIADRLVDATLDKAISAIAPAAGAVQPAALLQANEAFTAALALANQFSAAAVFSPSRIDRALLVGAGGMMLSAAAQVMADIEPESREQALTLRGQITAAIDAYSNSLQPLFETVLADCASRLNRAAQALRLRAVQDINEVIGRLPATVVIELDRPADAWAVANMLAGDRPQDLEAVYEDLVRRNHLRLPAFIPAGKLEILQNG